MIATSAPSPAPAPAAPRAHTTRRPQASDDSRSFADELGQQRPDHVDQSPVSPKPAGAGAASTENTPAASPSPAKPAAESQAEPAVSATVTANQPLAVEDEVPADAELLPEGGAKPATPVVANAPATADPADEVPAAPPAPKGAQESKGEPNEGANAAQAETIRSGSVVSANQPAATIDADATDSGVPVKPGTVSANTPAVAPNSDSVQPTAAGEVQPAETTPKQPSAQAQATPTVAPQETKAPARTTDTAPVAANEPMAAGEKTAAPTASTATVSAMSAVQAEAPPPATSAPQSTAASVTSAAQGQAMPATAGDEPAIGNRNGEAIGEAVRQLVSQGGGGKQSMTVRLDPPQLGGVRIHVRLVEGQMTATIGTSSEVAHSLVRSSVDQLQSSLERSGITVDRIQITRMSPASATDTGGNAGRDNNPGGDGQSAGREQMQHQQREQHRRETLLRLWQRGGLDAEAA